MSVARALRNIGSGYAGSAVNGVVLLLLTPLVIRYLGPRDYAIWVLTAAIGSYLGFLNAGSGPTGVRSVAALAGAGRMQEASRAVGSVFRIYLGVGVFACGALILLSFTALDRFHVAPERQAMARVLLILIAVNFLVSFPLGVTRSVLVGLHRFDVLNGIEIVSALFRLGATAAFLVAGFGLVALGGVQLAASAMGHAARWIAIRRIAPELHLTGGPQWQGLMPGVSAFSFLSFGYESLKTLFDNADLLLVGILAGPTAVGLLGVAVTLAAFVSKALRPVTGVLFPMASQMGALDQRSEASRLLEVGTRVNLALALPLLTLLLIDGSTILRVWVGAGFDSSLPILVAFALANLVSAASVTSATVLYAGGSVGTLLRAEAIKYALNVVLVLSFYRWWGLPGAAIATLLSVLLVDTWLIIGGACHRVGMEPGALLLRAVAAPILTAVPVGLFLAAWKRISPDPSVAALVLRSAVCLVSFALIYSISRTFREERRLVGKAWVEVFR